MTTKAYNVVNDAVNGIAVGFTVVIVTDEVFNVVNRWISWRIYCCKCNT